MVSLVATGVFGRFRAAGAVDDGRLQTDHGYDVTGIFSDPEAARSIGRCYLAAHPEEVVGARLLAAEFRRQQLPLPVAEGLRRALANRRRQDLEDGAVVVVGGWVLARTEARACALTVL